MSSSQFASHVNDHSALIFWKHAAASAAAASSAAAAAAASLPSLLPARDPLDPSPTATSSSIPGGVR